MTKVSSTNLGHRQGVLGRAKVLDFKIFHKQVGNEGNNGETHGTTMDWFIILTLEEEVCLFETELQKCDYFWYGHVGPCERSGSCCNFCLTMLMEGSTGTEVKRALTS